MSLALNLPTTLKNMSLGGVQPACFAPDHTMTTLKIELNELKFRLAETNKLIATYQEYKDA